MSDYLDSIDNNAKRAADTLDAIFSSQLELRDHFAMLIIPQALMPGHFADERVDQKWIERLCRHAYVIADAMLAARGKQEKA